MAGTIVDSIAIAVGIDGSRLGSDLQHVAQQADAAMRPVAEKLSTNFLAPFKGLLAPLIGALGITAAANEYMTAADAVGKLSDSLDIDIEDMQAWSEAAIRAGGSAGAFQGTVSSLTRQIQVAASMGKGPGATMLQELGIAFKDSSGKARDTLDVLRDLAGKAEGMGKQEFAGLAQKLGIDRGTIMLLQSGRASLDELIARQKSLGVYTKEDAEVAAKANDAMADFQQVIKALSAGLMRVFVPALTIVTEKLTVAVNFVREHKPAVLAAFGMVSAIITAKMIPSLLNMAKAGWAALRPFLPWIVVLGTAALLIDDFYAYLQGGDSLFADFWSSFGTGEEITQKLTAAWETFKSAAKAVMDALRPYIPLLAQIGVFAALAFSAFKVFSTAAKLLNPLGLAIMGIALLATAVVKNWENIAPWFSKMWQGVTDIFSGWAKWLKGIFTGDIDAIVEGGKKVWNGLVNFLTGIWNTIGGIIEGALKIIDGLLGTDIAKGFRETFDALNTALAAIWNAIKTVFSTSVDFIAKLFTYDYGAAFRATWDALVSWASSVWEAIKAPFVAASNFIKSLFGNDDTGNRWAAVWGAIASVLSGTWEAIKAPFTGAFNFIKNLFGGDDTGSKWAGTWSAIGATISATWETIKAPFKSAYDFIHNLFSSDDTASTWSKSWEFLTGFFSGLWKGITGIFEGAFKVIGGIMNAVSGFISKIFGDRDKAVAAEKETRAAVEREGQVLTYEEAQAMMGGATNPAKPTPADNVRATTMEAGKTRMVEQTNNSTVNVGKVEVVTPATDADGIAGAMGSALQAKGRNMDIVYSAQTGTLQKGGL